MISLEKVPVAVSGVVGRVLENKEPGKSEAVIVLPGKGQVKVLNDVGARIWSLIDGKRSIADIVQAIVDEYQVAQNVAESDTIGFIDSLKEKGIIDFCS